STVGTISATGLYTAPARVINGAVSVEADMAAATSAFASADIFVSGLIAISPKNPQVTYGTSQQFSGQVIGGNDTQISWRAGWGTMTSSGMYTASMPQTPDTISAWTADSRGSTSVQVIGVTPVITSVSPQPATVGDQITITGQNLNTGLTAVFSDPAGEPIPIKGSVVSGTSATVTVPQGAVTGVFYVQTAQGGLAPVSSNTLQFQRLARLRIRSPQNDLGAGESVTLQYALLGDSTPHTVQFTADQGTFSGSTYFAPASLTADSFAHIKACITGTQSCDKLILGLHPFRISPAVPLVPLGGTLQLSDVGAGGVNWNLLAGGGSLSSGGLYNAGTTYQAGGPALVSASSSSVTEQTSVGVTGAFPGLLNRIFDYADQHNQPIKNTYTLGLAINGSRMFVPATDYIGANNSYYWIDVYDISDPLDPAWVTAVESYSAGPLFSTGQYFYSYQTSDPTLPGYPNTITLYAIQGGVPVLRARTQFGQQWSIGDNNGVLTMTPFYGGQITEYDLTGGTIASRSYTVPLPSDANQFAMDTSIRVGNRLFVSTETNDLMLGGYILTYDLSASPPTLLGKINARSLDFYASGNLLFGALGGMEIYDISSQLPIQQGYVEGINAHQLVGTKLLARTAQQGCEIVDLSNPQQPKVTSILFDGVISGDGCGRGVMSGNYVLDEEYDGGGIVIYDDAMTGGPVVQKYLYGGAHGLMYPYDLLLNSSTLYSASTGYDGAVLDIFDLTTSPATLVGEYDDGTQAGYAVQAISHYIYFGMSSNIGVIDVSQPSSPTLVATVPAPTASLARANNIIYAGTGNNTLVVLNASNPSSPVIVRTIALPDLPIKMRVAGNLLLIADNAAGLLIYDISSPQSPILLSKLQSFVYAGDVAVQGTTA